MTQSKLLSLTPYMRVTAQQNPERLRIVGRYACAPASILRGRQS